MSCKVFKNNLPVSCPENSYEDETMDRIYYRICQNSLPTVDDFTPVSQNPKRPIRDDQKCLAHGLSLYTEYEDVLIAIKHSPNIGSYIYSGIIRPIFDGIVKLTPSKGNRTMQAKPSHRTWYPCEETNELAIFCVLSANLANGGNHESN